MKNQFYLLRQREHILYIILDLDENVGNVFLIFLKIYYRSSIIFSVKNKKDLFGFGIMKRFKYAILSILGEI